jgi:hypothetical protein
MVRFEDANEWKVFHSVDSDTIQAYVTDLPDALSKRPPPEAKRTVAEARLLLSNSPIPACMYDLPGIGSIGNKHLAVTYSALERADCIVYVASSEKPIGEDQLDLLRFIYKHYQATGKRTLFLLSQIDKHRQLDPASNKFIWEDVLAANDEFIKGAFPNTNFIGKGFLAVSAAEEAKGLALAKTERLAGEKLVDQSRMPMLRRLLLDYLTSTTGPLHLTQIIREVERALTPLLRTLSEQLCAEQTPIVGAETEKHARIEYKNTLIKGQQEIRTALTHAADEAVSRVFTTSRPGDLSTLMQHRLVPRIQSEDVLRQRVIHEIELERGEIIREWVQRPGGFSARWEEAFHIFKDAADTRALDLLGRALEIRTERTMLDTRGTHDRARSSQTRGSQIFRETLDVATNAWTLLTTIGAGGLITSATAGLVTLTPLGLAVILTAMLTGWFASWRKADARERRRQQMIEELGQRAKETVTAYRDRACDFLKAYIGNVMSAIDGEIRANNKAIDTLTRRITSPEYGKQKERLLRVKELHERAMTIKSDISGFHRVASRQLHN